MNISLKINNLWINQIVLFINLYDYFMSFNTKSNGFIVIFHYFYFFYKKYNGFIWIFDFKKINGWINQIVLFINL